MALSQEFIPSLEIPIVNATGEQAVLSWDLAFLKTQLNVTISSVVWTVEDGTVLSVGTVGNTGDVFFTPVTALKVGCSHLIADVTTSDSNQNPTFLFIKVFVIDPKCANL